MKPLDTDKYLSKRFHITNYNCWHFVRDVWFELTNEMLYDFTPAKTTKHELQLAAEDARYRFTQVPKGSTTAPLIVLMKRYRDVPHIGVLYKGKVLHLRPEGVMYQPLDVASVGFDDVLYYTTLSHS